ncbi:threonine/serine dehydratase [Kiloniella laminariae]|uniref:threonine/serine dehydratase n=1 Tax=Kiloniella laminariae TaxID=454162 RepID=UPI000364AA64|nr:threonine/serine dehydratase [Kiloniella laminariae]
MDVSARVSQASILGAYERIQPFVRRTPVLRVPAGELLESTPVTLKLEQLQHAGSFKSRGAFNALLSDGEIPEAGVIAASGGNHGAAVAYAAKQLGIRAEIFVPEIVSASKLAKLEQYGASIHVVGHDFAAALEACSLRQKETGARLLHAYDQPDIVSGQGTVGLELSEQAPELDSLLVAVGGGGLIGGIASWYQGSLKIIAVETEGTASLYTARQKDRPTEITVSGRAADSLGARKIGEIGFEAAKRFVQQSVLVRDEAVAHAQEKLWSDFRVIAEPGGATAFAALLSGAYQPEKDEKVGVLVCGGNADLATF